MNDGKGNFDDRTIAAGIAVETRFVNWGTGIVDLDNDGNPDHFSSDWKCLSGSGTEDPRLSLQNAERHFSKPGKRSARGANRTGGPGSIRRVIASRGCAFGDFDNDGDIDILIVNLNEPPSLLRNDLKSNHHWLKIKLIGSESNRSAIGARVTCRYNGKRQMQEVLAQSSFYSSAISGYILGWDQQRQPTWRSAGRMAWFSN